MRAIPLISSLAALATAAAAAQAPPVQNATIQTRAVTTIARDVAAATSGPDPVWVAWRVPMVDGDRDVCSTWSDGITTVRGESLEPATGDRRPAFAPRGGPLALEGGTTLLVLVRVVSGHVERLRSVGDDCPLDAGGRTLVWLTGVEAGASIAYLDTLLTGARADTDLARRTARSAASAIALHRDSAADAVLTRLLADRTDSSLRALAAQWLVRARGASGRERVLAALRSDSDASFRRTLVSAASLSRDPSVVDAFRTAAHTDADAGVRGEALYWFAQMSGPAAIPEVLRIAQADSDAAVRRRAVAGIARLPAGRGVTPLIELARTTTNATLKRDVVRVLGDSPDPRAVAYMEEIVRGR